MSWLAHDRRRCLADEDRRALIAATNLEGRFYELFLKTGVKRIMGAFRIPKPGGMGAFENALRCWMGGSSKRPFAAQENLACSN